MWSDRHALTKSPPTSLHMRVHVGLAHDLPIVGSYLLVPGTSIKQADDGDARLPLDFRVWETTHRSDTECVASALLSCSTVGCLKSESLAGLPAASRSRDTDFKESLIQ